MFLKNLNLKDNLIIVIQAFLFWIFHSFYLFSLPITFWIYLPYQSIIFGIIVWRTKSIGSSTIGHFLNNILIALVR